MGAERKEVASALVLLGDTSLAAAIPTGADAIATVRCSDIGEARALFTGQELSCLIATRRDAHGRAIDGLVRALLKRAPQLAVAVIVGGGDADVEDLVSIAGHSSVELIDDDDPELRRKLVRLALRSSPHRRLRGYATRIEEAIPGVAGAMASRLIRAAERPPSIATLAMELGESERSLRRESWRELRCCPRTWAGDSGLLASLVWLESTGLSAEQVALRGRWSNLSALQHAARRSYAMALWTVTKTIGSVGHFQNMMRRCGLSE